MNLRPGDSYLSVIFRQMGIIGRPSGAPSAEPPGRAPPGGEPLKAETAERTARFPEPWPQCSMIPFWPKKDHRYDSAARKGTSERMLIVTFSIKYSKRYESPPRRLIPLCDFWANGYHWQPKWGAKRGTAGPPKNSSLRSSHHKLGIPRRRRNFQSS